MLDNQSAENKNKEGLNQDPSNNTNDADNATVGMKGVSGKVIKANVSKVKRVKKADKPKEADAEKTVEKTVTAETAPAQSTKTDSATRSGQRIVKPSSTPMPRKLGNIQDLEKSKAEAKATVEQAAPKTADEAVAKTAEKPEAKKTETTKPSTSASTPRPRKISAGTGSLPQPRKIKSAAQVEAEAKQEAAEARQEAAEAKQEAVGTKQETTSSSTTSISQKTQEVQRPTGPRKLASGDNIGAKGPRKISSATDGALAATAKAFAKEKAEKERRKSRNFAQAQPGGGGRRQDNRGRKPADKDGYNPYAKDEDTDKKPISQPRKPRKKTTGEAPIETKPVQKRQDNKSKTRSRNFAAERKSSKQAEREAELNRQYRERRRQRKSDAQSVDKTLVSHVALPETMTVKEFAEAIARTAANVIMHLMQNGVMVTLNDYIDFDTATIIASEFDITTEKLDKTEEREADLFDESDDIEENLVERPPVVVVMGHVDHGKTTLLDYIRQSDVADGEAGGITQGVGAYMVEADDRKITFLDTPGHEAFTSMRARGAQATDIAILVVAADDGVMPQTIEAINHAKAAETEIIVAVNKMDKPTANPDRIKEQLTKYDLIAEEWGGDTIMVPISALTGDGVDELLEMVLLTADIKELKADPVKQAKGIIIEAELDKNRGVVVNALVQRGTLKQGDTILADTVVGNVRAMTNSRGEQIDEAGPSVPVQILGLPDVPEVGTIFYKVDNERKARAYADQRTEDEREEGFRQAQIVTLDNLFTHIEAGMVTDFNVIIKADVVGSAEAMKQSLEKLSNEEIRVNVIHSAAGAINESDIRLAEASNAVIIGFNVRPPASVTDLAKDLEVDIRLYSVIYKAIEEVEDAMKGRLEPEFEEVVLGHVEIRDVFSHSSIGTIGGGYVTDGKITRNSECRVIRDGIVMHDGRIGSLRRFDDDVREVNTGYECGLTIDGYNNIEVGDIVETYVMQEVAR